MGASHGLGIGALGLSVYGRLDGARLASTPRSMASGRGGARMSLWSRVKALEHDLAQAKRDRALQPRWQAELHTAQRALAESASHAQPRRGCDYSWARPTIQELRSQGITFAGRYLSGGGKALTEREALRLSAGGIALFSIYEMGAMNMAGGRVAGEQDGREALRAGRYIGMPRNRPIYFAADWDVQEDQVSACLSYLEQARAVMKGYYFAGIYGGRRVIEAARNAGFQYLYQTLAWSQGIRVPHAQIYQSGIAGQIDTDWAYAADFGQWTL